MESRKKLLVINQYFAPDIASTGQYAAEICKGLTHIGFEVHVVTGQPSYTESSPNAPEFEMLNGVNIYRVSLGGARGRERLIIRIKGYLWFLFNAWRKSQKLVNSLNFDCVMSFHNPPFSGLIGAFLKRRCGIRFVYVSYDIHPDALIIGGWKLPRVIIWIWNLINHFVFKHADGIVVLVEGAKRTLVNDKGVISEKVHVIPLWAIPELEPLPRNHSVRDKLGIRENELLLLYAGNMGIMHPLDPILEAAAILRGLPVHFLFIGSGVRAQYLVSKVKKENLANVRFLPYQPEEDFIQLIGAADACIVAFQFGMERITVPSRAYTFLSAGRPLITIMAPDADIARLVTETECGWNVTTGQELADLIRQLLNAPQELARRGQKGRKVYEERFRRESIIKEYTRVLTGIGMG